MSVVWFAAVGLLFVVLVVQTLFGKFGDAAAAAWNWFLPNVMPTLSLIVATLVRDAFQSSREGRVREEVYFAALGLSTIYLLLIAAIVLAQPFTGRGLLEFAEHSGLFLGPLQGLVAGALGVFYSSRGNE